MAIAVPSKRRTITVSFPAELAELAERIAASEHRTMSELFREAIRTYRTTQTQSVLDAYRATSKKTSNPFTEEDVEGLVDEARENRIKGHL